MDEFYQKQTELGQGPFDLAIQEYGNIEAVFMVLEDNPGLDLLANVPAGTTVRFRHAPPSDVVTDGETMQFMRRNEVRVNNAQFV